MTTQPSWRSPSSNPSSDAHIQGPLGHHGTPAPPPPPPPAPLSAPSPASPAASLRPDMAPGAVYVVPPKIKVQPWARNLWRWLADNTTGVARVDLRRPTAPSPEQYGGNILVVRNRHDGTAASAKAARGDRPLPPPPAYATPLYGTAYPVVQPAPLAGSAMGLSQPFLTGARIKITRSLIIGGGGGGGWSDAHSAAAPPDSEAPHNASPTVGGDVTGTNGGAGGDVASSNNNGGGGEGSGRGSYAVPSVSAAPVAALGNARRRVPGFLSDKPLLDIGVGVNLDVEQQQIQPVARIKIKDLLSIKAAPFGLLKISRSIPLGPVALKFRYELPLSHAARFWEPPARLMVRLDNAAGSGIHLTPGGIEFDEQVLRFGTAVSLRASAALAFPRQLPLQEGEQPLKLQVHRLSLKSIW